MKSAACKHGTATRSRHHHPARASTRSLLALLAALTIALTLLGLAGEGLLPD